MMAIISLMTAVFWGQLSNCEPVAEEIEQYSCSQHAAYGAVSAFAAMLFVTQFVFMGALILWKSEIVEDIGSYDDLPRYSSRGETSETPERFHSPTAVDL